MDRQAAQAKERWSWLPVAMPKVAQLVADFRKQYGAEHVARCWAKGMACEPGWFFAREGAVAIGTPWLPVQDPVLAEATRLDLKADQALVWMRKPGVAYGTD